jgi:tungstate transport system ATP-binding protein
VKAGQAIIELKDVRLKRGSRITLDVSHLKIFPGENVAVIGANGSGKSTLLQVIACLLHPGEGRVYAGGRVVGSEISAIEARRRMAMVLQRPYLLDATVFDNVAIGLRMRHVPHKEVQVRVEEALALFGIGHLAQRRGRSLSGGESQRVSLARAMVLRPEVLLLDEPMSSLDVPTRMALLEELGRIIKKTRVTTVYVTHDVTEIPFLSDRTVIMEGGKIIADGPVREVLREEMRGALSQLAGAANWLLAEDGGG